MNAIPKTYDDYRFAVMSAISPIVHLDIALLELKANPRRPPTLHAGSTPDLLAWGVDSAVSAARLLLSGQILGAAAMIRNQLERWMSQRATSLGIEQGPGESTLAFVARTWSHPDALHDQWLEKHAEMVRNLFEGDEDEAYSETIPAWVHKAAERGGEVPEHLHVYRSNGTDVCPALVYGLLSEILHLRAFTNAAIWDSNILAPDRRNHDDVLFAGMVVCDAIFLVLREIRLSAVKLAKQRGLSSVVKILSSGMDSISMDAVHTDLVYEAIPFGVGRMRETIIPSVACLAPLLPREGLSNSMVAVVRGLALDYEAVLRKERPAGRLYQDDELAVRSFAWHRLRSVKVAAKSLEWEREALGTDFNEDILTGRSTRWILLTEAASLLALWHPRPGVRNAASALASSLRSAYWLWLEDDDRAMAILRSSLEYVARLRTWRRKPSKAESLDVRPQTTPRDWITQAGWKRLHLLNQILGEFAHAQKMKDWPAARQLLSELQLNVEEGKAIYTARGAAIDLVSSLAAREVVALISEVSSSVAAAVGHTLQELDFELSEDAADVEAQFAHIWMLRSQQVRE
jgi:hypothetical protein